MRHALLVFVVLSAGCYPDLGVYRIGERDAGPPRPGVDAGPPRTGFDAGPPRDRFGGPCARPTLLLAAQSLGDAPSQILRYELHGTAGIVPCGPAAADGELTREPFAVVGVNERFALLAGRGGVDGVDPVDDRRLYHLDAPGLHPNDAFALPDPLRGDYVAIVAWSTAGGGADLRGSIREVRAYSADGVERRSWTGSELTLGASTALAANVHLPAGSLAVNSAVFAGAEVDLWFASRSDPALVPPFASTVLHSLHTGRGRDGRETFVWSGVVRGEPSMVVIRDPYSSLDDVERTGLCESVLCDPVHAVVDPSSDHAVIAICRRDGVHFEVQRFDLSRSVCETLIDSATLGDLRPWYASILE